MGFPWCAFAVFLAALAEGGRTAALGLRGVSVNALYTPDVLAAAEKGRFGLQVVPEQEARRGDLVLFDWNPTGGDPADRVARLVEPPENGHVRTVDGNSGGNGARAAPGAVEPLRARIRPRLVTDTHSNGGTRRAKAATRGRRYGSVHGRCRA
jgi:hypothetical protein